MLKEIFLKQKAYAKDWKDHLDDLKPKLIRLKDTLIKYEDEIYHALYEDLNKTKNEAYLTEYQLVLDEVKWFIKHFDRIYKIKTYRDNLWFVGHYSQTMREPYGVSVIYSPYNYPFNLSMIPIIGALACSNTVILKPSKVTKQTTKIIKKILSEVFSDNQCYVIEDELNDPDLYDKLYALDFDLAFFTGGEKVGREIYSTYAKKLIPVTLELGGKCPVIVDNSADLDLVARRIVWAKTINNGQTCVGPDYLVVHETQFNTLVLKIQKELKKQFPHEKKDLIANLSSIKAQDKINDLAQGQNVIFEYKFNDHKSLKLIEVNDLDNPIMQCEIFGPLLPILKYKNWDDMLQIVDFNPYPLAMYVFTKEDHVTDLLRYHTKSGAIVVNDLLLHLTKHVPFGGIKNSGVGQYHKEFSIRTFSHEKPIVHSSKMDFNFRYQPYTDFKFRRMKKLLK